MKKNMRYSGEVLGGEESVPIPDAFDQKQLYNSIDIKIPDATPPLIRAYVKEGEVIDKEDALVKVGVVTLLGLVDNVEYIQVGKREIKVLNHDLIDE